MGPLQLCAATILVAVQVSQASVVGTVRDSETGAPLAGAVVALPDHERAVETDADGRYKLPDVPPGPHHVTVRFIGYAQRTVHALVPRTGQLDINFSLRPDPVRLEAVDVRAPVSLRGLDSGDSTIFPDREASASMIQNHPLLAEPDVFEALGGGDVVLRPETPGGIQIRGGASDQTAYLLDGIPVFSPFHAAGVASALNPDAISRLRVASSGPPLASPHTLSGSVEAATRAPGDRVRGHGSVSTSQARLTVDGPVGRAGIGFLASLRSNFAGLFPRKTEASHLGGKTGDVLGKLEWGALGGRARLLGYDSENQIDGAAAAGAQGAAPRNVFEWHSQSLGAEWRRPFSDIEVRFLGWSARGDAGARWEVEAGRIRLAADRRDLGLLVDAERRSAHATIGAGIRVERSRTMYRVESDSSRAPIWNMDGRTPVATLFARHGRQAGRRVELDGGISLAVTEDEARLGPRARFRWTASKDLKLSGSYARTHQFIQSLRNAESIVGTVFPADLFMGSGAPGVPVARSDEGSIAADYHPAPGLRLVAKAYERRSDGLLLVAPRDGEPFSTGAFVVGSGSSRGVSLDAAFSTARYGVVASYGYQRVRLAYGDSSYVPDAGAGHLLEGGVIYFPSATSSVRIGATAAMGRRSTTVPGTFEWEACNLLDQGCEFGGSPHYGGEPLGATPLPNYLRVDMGVRHHWHLGVRGRDVLIALFGTVTNVLGRRNVLTYSRDTATGQLVAVEMRPRAPLVIGLDCRF